MGAPANALACSKASARAAKSCPSTGMTFQPNEVSFWSKGSVGMTSAVLPSIWSPFTSITAQRLSKWYLAALMNASQTCPSSISPSPRTV